MSLLSKTNEDRISLEKKRESMAMSLETLRMELESSQKELFEISVRELHIAEIYRQAKNQFPRLRREKVHELNPRDILELDKWILRAHSVESLQGIIESIHELGKYQPGDIKTNLYALVQKIIIDGPYKGRK